jgi:sigma-B regulation protein RsbU (phosphoserine phosphatase)
MFYGVINWSSHQLRYSGGGQFPFPILFDGEHASYVGKKSLPIGLFDFANYQTESLQLPPQFALVLISDGILETLPQISLRDKQAFLLEIVDATELTIENLIQELGLDQSGSLPDDVTLLLIKRVE